MSDYSKVNFLDIDSSSQNEAVQARFARKLLDSDEIGVSLFRYAPNFQAEMAHSHKVQEEIYVVVSGSGKILLNNKTEDLKAWDVIRVAPSVVRAFSAGSEGLEVLALGGQKPEEGDGVRQDAVWPA